MPASTAAPVPAPTSQLHLVVGLGNPGKSYAETRHNAGFLLIDELARRWNLALRERAKWKAAVAGPPPCHLMKPLTFMNRSGDAAGPYAGFFKIPPAQVLVVLDDTALPCGRIRLRPGGSSGGHNGLRSILDRFGTTSVPRLRLGIGASTPVLRDYVLDNFTKEEIPAVEQMIQLAADATGHILENGIESAMNHYNTNTQSNP